MEGRGVPWNSNRLEFNNSFSSNFREFAGRSNAVCSYLYFESILKSIRLRSSLKFSDILSDFVEFLESGRMDSNYSQRFESNFLECRRTSLEFSRNVFDILIRAELKWSCISKKSIYRSWIYSEYVHLISWKFQWIHIRGSVKCKV